MSIQDTATKQYVSEAEVFADAFNYLIYDGEQVIKPEQLTDMDTTQYVIPYHEDEKGKPEAAQKYRDTLKTLAVICFMWLANTVFYRIRYKENTVFRRIII